MKINIRKGTDQIGGCITEISSQKGTKIVIDFGEDLPNEEKDLRVSPEIDGLTRGESTYSAVFITHSHGDHIGLISKINLDIPIYVEKDSQKIYELTCDFTNQEYISRKLEAFRFGHPIEIDDMIITPFRVDHSAYHSAMFLIECDGKVVLHTGDFRSHGRKGKEFLDTLYQISEKTIDVLITEGTSFGREDTIYQTEVGLEVEATDLFQKYDQVFILQSSTNIDRLVSFYKAAVRTGKYFIEDLFTATITMHLGKTIPNPVTFSKVSVWIPRRYQSKPSYFKKKYMDPIKKYQRSDVVHGKYAMMVKNSMIEDLQMLKKKPDCMTKTCLVYSMWEGYRDRESMKKFLEEVRHLGIEIEALHTSGHADIETMRLVNHILKPKLVIPIHTTHKDRAKEIFSNVKILEDQEEFTV